MIYLDSSVALARLLVEPRQPAESFWDQALISSRLIEYEVWSRLHRHQLAGQLGDTVRALFDRVDFVELSPLALARALEPFPIQLRTLDSLHLATVEYLREHGTALSLASYDNRMLAAARALGVAMYDL